MTRHADEDRAGGRNTMTRDADPDLCLEEGEVVTHEFWSSLAPEEQDRLIASGWHPGPASHGG